MAAGLNLTLHFDGRCWYTRINDHDITAPDLTALEARITRVVHNLPGIAAHESVNVHLNCDTGILPTWLRQYHSHYFNSTLIILIPGSQTTGAGA